MGAPALSPWYLGGALPSSSQLPTSPCPQLGQPHSAGLPEKGPRHKAARETPVTLHKQVGGVDCLSLDAVCATGVGTSVLPTDRRHRQAPITHLGPGRDEAQHPPGACPTPPSGGVGLGAHALGETEEGPRFSSPSNDTPQPVCLLLPSLSVPLHSVTGPMERETALERKKEAKGGRREGEGEGGSGPTNSTPTWYFPLAPRSVPSLSQVTIGLGFPKAVQVMVTLPPSLASMYWGGVSVKVGGAAKRPQRLRV